MQHEISRYKLSEKSWILWGIPVLCAAGCVMHFIYNWSGKLTIVGLFAPVNESVWEHLKLAVWPMLLWWITGYCILSKNIGNSYPGWFVSCVTAQIVCPLVIVSFFYTYTGSLGIESLILDIFSFFLAIACGQGLALHVYTHAKSSNLRLYCSIIILVMLASFFALFTFNPPHIPAFMDSLTGKFGI